MGIWKWLTETPDQRRQRQRAEQRERVNEYRKPTTHPDDWGPGYGVNWDWGKSRKQRH
jgi:hypothetical protein